MHNIASRTFFPSNTHSGIILKMNSIAFILLVIAQNKNCFFVNFFLLTFVCLLLGTFIFQNRRDKKLRLLLQADFEEKMAEERIKWEDTCNKCAQSNESLIHELKQAFDKTLIEKEGQKRVYMLTKKASQKYQKLTKHNREPVETEKK